MARTKIETGTINNSVLKKVNGLDCVPKNVDYDEVTYYIDVADTPDWSTDPAGMEFDENLGEDIDSSELLDGIQYLSDSQPWIASVLDCMPDGLREIQEEKILSGFRSLEFAILNGIPMELVDASDKAFKKAMRSNKGIKSQGRN